MKSSQRWTYWSAIGGFTLGFLLVALYSCNPVRSAVQSVIAPPIESHKPPVSATPEPKTGDEWRAQKQSFLDQIDANDRANAVLRQQIGASDRRADIAEREAQRATVRTQATWGRRIAFLCFAASVLCTILSFTPIGKLLPMWVGPAGMSGGVAILVAAQCWVWVFNHILQLSIGAGCIGALIGLGLFFKSGILLRIRSTFAGDLEDAQKAPTLSKQMELTLQAKADSLAAELKAGVHAMGQRLRGKPIKTQADVVALRTAAGTARISVPDPANDLMPTTQIIGKS